MISMTATANNQKQGYLYTFSKSSFGISEDTRSLSTPSPDGIIKVIMADDHPYLIHGVEADLNKDPRIKMVDSSSSYDELLIKNLNQKPDVILLDLRMPGKDQYELKDFIAKLHNGSNCKVIVFTNETGWARVHRCLEIGASAYVEKAIALGRLSEFIHSVHEDNELLIYTAEQLPQVQFSPRQKEILHNIADGKENDQIAKTLEIEIKTVQSYVNEIKAKLAEAFQIHPIRPRTLMMLSNKLGFGHRLS